VAITHRVIGITEMSGGYCYEIKSDANTDADVDPVPHENVIRTVVLTIPYIGRHPVRQHN
jgi:signal peptidase I